jgi:hypothetical protein
MTLGRKLERNFGLSSEKNIVENSTSRGKQIVVINI